jgi:hypothetical protein
MRTRFGWMAAVATYLLSAAVLVVALNGPAAAQLANADWPMLQHDLCHTGQSSKPGPHFTTNPLQEVSRSGPQDLPGRIRPSATRSRCSRSSARVESSTSVRDLPFAPSTPPPPRRQPDATVVCADQRRRVRLGAAIGADGTIYFGDRDNTFLRSRREREQKVGLQSRLRGRHRDLAGNLPCRRHDLLRPHAELRWPRYVHGPQAGRGAQMEGRGGPVRHHVVAGNWP